jgi:hypothetical protein
MKKFRSALCLLLAVMMLAVCFTGCSKKTATSSSAASASASAAQSTSASTASSSAASSSSAANAQDYASMDNVNIRFAQFGNSLDDADGYANDPIRAQIEKDLNITVEYDTGTDGFDDRMQTELYTGSGPDLFPTWGETDKIAKYIEDGLVTNIGDIINASPDRYPTLYKIINSAEYKAYNKLYTGDENTTYAIYSVAAFAEPSFAGVSVYNQSILDEVNGGKVPATVDEFMTYCEAAGKAGYVGWWPRNDKLTNWAEIDAELALPQGTSIQAPSAAGTGTVLSGELGTDSEKWTITATSDASKAVVKQLAELYKTGGLDANIGVKGDFDDAYADFGAGKLGAVNFGFGYPGQFRDFYNAAWASVKTDASPDDLTVGQALTSDGNYGPIYDTGTWINSHYFIPTSCTYPDRVLDLVEYIASSKGQDLLQNCTDGQFRTDQGSDYWKAIDGAYGYGDGRCKYCWFSYMFSGTEYYVDFTNNDWWTAVSNPTDFSSNWATETDNQLVQKARDTVSAYVDKVHIVLPSYYNMIALPSEATDIISKLSDTTNEYLAQFIGGQLDVDASWADYVKAYQDAGAADLETMINEAVATARTNYATK